jgi:Asp-tRNA(Asn)/Glu-tRNA(Gln) amidotransferase A subunit family amidase
MTPDCARDSVVARSCYATIADIGACIRRQQISPVELLQSCLERIYNLNPTLNAFITILAHTQRRRHGTDIEYSGRT